jgi:hypothetical protein
MPARECEADRVARAGNYAPHFVHLESEPFRIYDNVSGLAGAKARRTSSLTTDHAITGLDDRRNNATQ